MKASRHNGRSGKHGVYDVKHNDRDFDVEHSEHIDSERTKQNVYWDCYQGYSFAGSSQERQFNFTEIERAYYYEHYSDFVDAQNERNELCEIVSWKTDLKAFHIIHKCACKIIVISVN